MINRVVRECKHNGVVTKCLHRVKLSDDGWTKYECLACGAVSFSKPFDKVRKDAKLMLDKVPKVDYLKRD